MYRSGINRIYYQTNDFTSADILVYFYKPCGTLTGSFNFTELETGIYFLDMDFCVLGDWLGIFYEDGNKVATRVFKVDLEPFSYFVYGQPLH